MGLGLDKSTRQKIEEVLAALSCDWRRRTGDPCGPTELSDVGKPPARVGRVVVDAPTWFRSHAPSKIETTVAALARRLLDKVFPLLSPEFTDGSAGTPAEIYILFDTQPYMPPERERVVLRRNPPATPDAIAQARRDPLHQKVVVNGRIFDVADRPLSSDEIAALDENSPFLFPRAMNSRAGKECVWGLLWTAVVRAAAESCKEHQSCRLIVDGPGTGDECVWTLERGPEGGAATVVNVSRAPREFHFGEADQKCAFISTLVPPADPTAATVVVTIDRDMLAQQVLLAGLLSAVGHRGHDNVFICFLQHAAAKSGGPQFVDCGGFGTLGNRGSTVAMLLTLGGSDYTTSIKGAAVNPGHAIKEVADLMALKPCFSLTADNSGIIHPSGLVDAIARAYTGRNPAPVFCFDDSNGQFYISKAAPERRYANDRAPRPTFTAIFWTQCG